MPSLGWVSGKILHYDLSSGRSWVEELPEKIYRLVLGGRGLAAYLLYRLLGKGVDPLGPDNVLVFSPGLFLGSGLTTASKTIIAARSPLTGFLGRSSVGARLGVEIRRLGYDALVIHGSLEEPGVLVVDRDGARVEPAKELWGMLIGEARRRLGELLPGYESCVIGPAGEHLSAMALIDCNGRQAGRTGLGAVMGAKRLKAVLVKGYASPRPARPEKVRELVRKWAVELPRHPGSKNLIEYGTPAIITLTNKVHGVFPGLNWRESTLDWCPQGSEKAMEALGFWAPRKRVGRNPCPFCNRVCSQVVEAEVPGKGHVRVDGPEYETVYALGSNLGFCDVEPVAILNYLADEYGLDSISLGATLSWAIEALERGDLSREDVDGLDLRWGNLDALMDAVRRIALREGRLGELLADGSRRAAMKVGKGLEYAIQVKGLELPAYDARGLKGMALGFAVSSRGGDHLTSGAYAVELPGKLWVYEGVDARSSRGKGVLVKEMEDLMAVYDVTGVCKFSRYALTPEPLAEFASALLGVDMSPGDLLLVGERVVNLERLFNLREGLTPSHDTLPERLLREPIRRGPCEGCVVRPDELEEMKKEYYAARGWSPDGKPSLAKLVELSLTEIIDVEEGLVEKRV
ncbi:aldehyde ferredoxin oxidoreductase family protein [Pyrofollis japonicus]|uniref:aldehyde ferredoxin oxidoreductase family protein n=1 Tax=Pyrofollis japonicus TaxID=3060460 RepID=UPI00295B416C|nr:aldehyde ferredoxin oxidoreductase family protein [Pyrofollis japonicus]BEP18709.1 aldehyde ferredoxin oxidoreductase family protein [Pyrofollis japonicus]